MSDERAMIDSEATTAGAVRQTLSERTLTPARLAELRRIAEAANTVEQLPLEERQLPENLWRCVTYGREFTPPTVLAMLDEIERLRRERAYVKENAEFLRSSVGECHLMISRNSSEFQTQGKQWRLSDLPARLQRIMRERETLAAAVTAQHDRNDHIAECDQCSFDLCPTGGELSYRAKRALVTALALLDGEKGDGIRGA